MLDVNTAKTNEMSNSLISVRDINFSYTQNTGKDNFSVSVDKLDIYQGERIALIGPNGAGKTTLLQILTLLQQPQQGSIIFNGTEIKFKNQIFQYHRSTAFVPQKAVLYRGSVKDNVAIGLKIRCEKSSVIDKKVIEILMTFRIEYLANRPADRISGGEARRVMLARALVLNPQVLFLDEPFGDLDEPVRVELIEDLLPVLSQTGCAMIFVTHNQDETYQLADRFMVMIKGKIVQSGKAQEIFGNPLTRDVAEFIGIKNIIPAKVLRVENDIITVSLSTDLKLSVTGDKPRTSEVVICIPPDAITIVAKQSDNLQVSSRNIIPGVIKKIIPSRHFAWVEIDCGVTLTASVTNESVKEMNLIADKPVRLLIKSTAIRLLEK